MKEFGFNARGVFSFDSWLGMGFGSPLLAAILYQTSLGDFVYTTDGSGNVILDNQGSLGTDGLLYSGRGIELGATNDVTVGDAAKWTTYFDFATATHVTAFGVQTLNTKTINSILVSASQPSTATLTAFDANPNLVGKLALSGTGTISEVDLTLVAADEYYMCSEKSGAYLVDSRVAYGAEIIVNGTFDSTVSPWTARTRSTVALETQALRLTTTSVAGGFGGVANSSYVVNSGSSYIVSVEIKAFSVTNSAQKLYVFLFGSNTFYEVGNTIGTHTLIIDGVADGDIFELHLYSPVASSATIGDTVLFDNVTAQPVSAIPIANYAETIRTNADLQQKGIQTRPFVRDDAGVPTSYTSKILNYDSGSYDDTQWNPSLESAFWLEDVIDGVVYQHKYDGTNLTTYTDNVAGTPALHSPENASYLLGKGVYPKVTADTYTSYQCKYFSLHNGSLYTSYDQTARYAILAAL